ncbi:hypothetical protein BU24DRAFT_488810 [Aaosphaeria arxii CBS 175.79]|uniref:Allergen n=1 Tax=Aaosphaeria arxii CBS 175.79 TaxID=1450172 RepID=A0A6A5Y2C9_9PLEO|nr:uncharacterized protein BU24DRAFT_488810 [Aaosphaeria arxii CBS 175.79]KAF2018734.1 hypothetical protein BU24DRAFT_488810 [Aaosphaeria arxii CBS 175.79]
MDKAKQAISDFMSKSGHHDTTVHETVAPGVQHETIKPHRHEEIVTAIDKEIHQDHYHRTVQPVQDREVLPEKHTDNLGAVTHREFDHRDHEGTKRFLAKDQGGFRNKSITEKTTHSQSAAPTMAGEHIHHHIHETIQPIVQKETVQPHVVHTTVPIHETHHNAAKHHETSHLPPVSMAEFKEKGGILGGREERYDGFEGEPRNIGGAVAAGLKGHRRDDSHHEHHEHGVVDPEMKKRASHGDHSDFMGFGHGVGKPAVGATGAGTTAAGGGTGMGVVDGVKGKSATDAAAAEGRRGVSA